MSDFAFLRENEAAIEAGGSDAGVAPGRWEAWIVKLRGMDIGSLTVVVGLFILAAIFQSLNANFLTAGNLVNLMVQGAVYMLLAMGMIFVLLIGEIDLSIGFVGGVAGVTMAVLIYGNDGYPWWFGLTAGLLVGTAIGAFHGAIIAYLQLPSFVVTLAGMLAWNGVMLLILGLGGNTPIHDNIINSLANGLVPPRLAWLIVAIGIAVYAAIVARGNFRRWKKGSGSLRGRAMLLKIGAVALLSAAVVGLCSVDRGRLTDVRGVPIVLFIVIAFLIVWSVLLTRTALGNHIYAVGGNVEAARRAGIPLGKVRVLIFSLSGLMGSVAGIVYASRMRSVSTSLDGGTLVLYCIAAAVIGGASLFGGRGKPVHAILGGLVIATIDNGMGLLGLSAAARYVVTGIVLMVAVAFDSFARRGRTPTGTG
jgi:D-xylose transport system permease protein